MHIPVELPTFRFSRVATRLFRSVVLLFGRATSLRLFRRVGVMSRISEYLRFRIDRSTHAQVLATLLRKRLMRHGFCPRSHGRRAITASRRYYIRGVGMTRGFSIHAPKPFDLRLLRRVPTPNPLDPKRTGAHSKQFARGKNSS